MDQDIKVSILMPVYNGGKCIEKAIESAKAQSCKDWELVVVDDGSTDNTARIVSNFSKIDARIRYLKNEQNLGIQKTLNKGIREAKGIYIARLDDDDVWMDKNKLGAQVDFLDNNKDYVLAGTGAILVDESGAELARFFMPGEDKDIRNKILSKNCFIHSSVVFRREAALQFGGYDESLSSRHVEDYDLWLKLGTVGKFKNLQNYSVALMQSPGTISARNRIKQAWRSLRLMYRFRREYPGIFKALLIGLLRLVFAIAQKVFPLNNKILYKLKTRYKK